MQSSKFLEEKKADWERLRLLTRRITRHGYRRLTPAEARDFPNLYRKVCTDAETARTQRLAPDTIDYVNAIVLKAHSLLYTSPKKTAGRLGRFFTRDYPAAFASHFGYILIMVILLFGIGAITFAAVSQHPEYADSFFPKSFREMYKDPALRSAGDNIKMAAYYIMNNVSIAFGSFVFGVTFGLLTLYLIFTNATFIGAFFGATAAAGYGDNLFSFVIAHSSFELIGICIAAAAGLAMGVSLVRPGELKRSATFTAKAREVVPLFFMAGIFITLAAFIEGFVSANPAIPLWVKVAIAAASFLVIAAYSPLVFWKRLALFLRRARRARKAVAR